ncbi:MAG TPA: glycosyltransferase family 1 protein [Polyangiaceae bacterium]|jgi:alpha-1,3-rhamnosyl/mannosyltransferase
MNAGSAPIHVGIDATTWWNDRGFGRFTRELVRALVQRGAGFRYTLVVDQPDDGSLPPGTRVVAASPKRTLDQSAVGSSARSPAELWSMARVAARERFDLFFFPAVYSYFPLLSRTKTVVAFHDTIAERFPKLVFPTRRNHLLWQAKVALARQQAERVLTVSEASARDIVRFLGVARERIDVITEGPSPTFRRLPGIDLGSVRQRLRLPAEGELLVYVGGLSPHKNVISLLRALPAIVAGAPSVHLAIVGDISGKGFMDNVAQLRDFVAARPALAPHVTFTGYLPDEQLVELFQAASALVFPSLWEGFGLPAVEAMATGLPVLASERGSLPEVIADAGLFFEPDSPSGIARVCLKFLGDPALQQRLREAAESRVQRFTWSRAAELTELSFQRCLGKI